MKMVWTKIMVPSIAASKLSFSGKCSVAEWLLFSILIGWITDYKTEDVWCFVVIFVQASFMLHCLKYSVESRIKRKVSFLFLLLLKILLLLIISQVPLFLWKGTNKSSTSVCTVASYAFCAPMLYIEYTVCFLLTWVPMLHKVRSPKLEMNICLHVGLQCNP